MSKRTAGTRAMHCDLQLYLPGDLLAKVDILSMAHGLEFDVRFSIIAWSRKRWLFRSNIMWIECDQTNAVPFLLQVHTETIATTRKAGILRTARRLFRGPLRDMAYDSLLSPRADRGYSRPRRSAPCYRNIRAANGTTGTNFGLCSALRPGTRNT